MDLAALDVVVMAIWEQENANNNQRSVECPSSEFLNDLDDSHLRNLFEPGTEAPGTTIKAPQNRSEETEDEEHDVPNIGLQFRRRRNGTVETKVTRLMGVIQQIVLQHNVRDERGWRMETDGNYLESVHCRFVAETLTNEDDDAFQDQELNKHGALFIQKHPNMKLKVVDGSGLAVATVLHSIPKGTKQVFLHGNILSSKVIFAIVKALILDGVQVVTPCKDQVDILTLRFAPESQNNVILSTSYAHNKVWLVGESLEKDEQARAPKGTLFIPFSQFPIAQTRKDCVYYNTPAMKVPEALENMHSCERRVMSAWRVAGIVHALEGWNEHECGETLMEVEKVWTAALKHGTSSRQLALVQDPPQTPFSRDRLRRFGFGSKTTAHPALIGSSRTTNKESESEENTGSDFGEVKYCVQGRESQVFVLKSLI
ncbi:hypothetical protein Syun_022937 [Stephania yunnanensis]|uniref:Very-long-chain aldehyde decarbonylase CER1-like C-terminal domain-containing protein n=1 Tax=Stephania yunnanensis TaxID=152371 RepID=A0AAP0F806_9MAGN